MKYRNAQEVLPKELLREVQKYAAGTVLYIPVDETGTRQTSRELTRTDFKQSLLVRNQRIYNEYLAGKNITDLQKEYFLSLDTIKKIIYGKNKKWIPFESSIEVAKLYTDAGLSEEWVRTYLYRKTKDESVYHKELICDGLIYFPLRLLDEIHPVEYMVSVNEPMIVSFSDHRLICYGEEGLIQELKAQKRNAFPAFVIIECKEDFAFYRRNYGIPFSRR